MRILIVKLGAIGDVVHTLPAVAALRAHLPEAHLTWAVERGGASRLLAGTTVVDQRLELNLKGWRRLPPSRRSWEEMRVAFQNLRGERFDLSLDFQGLLKSASLPWLAGIRRRIGFERSALRERAAALFLTEEVAISPTVHIIEQYLGLVAHLGVRREGPYRFPIAVSPDEEEVAERLHESVGGRFVVLNPGGGWPTKLWHPAGFARLADRLWEERGLPSFLTIGPGEEGLAEAVLAEVRTGRLRKVLVGLKEYFALVRRADLFVGGDTGPMHLAAAAGTPIVALFGPTSAQRNGPFLAIDQIVERFDLDCRTDCYRRRCSHISCMKIPVDPVWEAVQQRLADTAFSEAPSSSSSRNEPL
jgi:heptosyltransferase-1